jgi:hypothetical protein
MSTPTSTAPDDRPAEWWEAAGREPQRAGIFEALRRFWFVVLIAIVLFTGLGLAYASTRTPEYTASSRLIVGGLSLSTPGAQAGFATAVQGLSEAYSRAVGADKVLAPVAKRFGTTPDVIRGAVNGTPLPNSPVFTISAASSDGGRAVQLANATTSALLRYLDQLYGDNPALARLRRAYRKAVADAATKRALASDRKQANEDSDTSASRRRYVAARAASDEAQLKVDTLAEQYRGAASSNVGSSTVVQVLSRASAATSDKRSNQQKYGAAGLIAGIVVGLGAALALANRSRRRSNRRA